jgi:hypothetical protein
VDYDRSIDNGGGSGGAAEFSASARELFIERDNLEFISSSRKNRANTT